MRYLHRRRDEQGAIAVLASLVLVILLGMAALSVDVADHVNERQGLHDTLDMAAHAGAASLPGNGMAAQSAVTAVAAGNDPDATPDIAFFCVVGSIAGAPAGTFAVNTTHIPVTCNPGPAPYTAAAYPGLRCNSSICAIPCVPATGDTCNTIRVTDSKDVPFAFAPILGIDQGNTGSLTSVACKGNCGTIAPNPIDFVVVGDRTGSMSSADVAGLRSGMAGLLEYLTPTQQRVALGTIGRSSTTAPNNCKSQPSASRTAGPWIPVGFSNTYDNTDVSPPSDPPVLTPNDPLAQAVTCLGSSGTGTYLASPMRAARELLQGPTARTCAVAFSPPAECPLPVKKAVIFMTDGEPNESQDPDGAGNYPWSSDGGDACNNVVGEANTAKNAGILVITIAYRLESVRCESGGAYVTTKLAEMASRTPSGAASVDDGGGIGAGCNTTAEVNGENADGDYFFCTPNPSALAPIFVTAAGSLVDGIRLIRLP